MVSSANTTLSLLVLISFFFGANIECKRSSFTRNSGEDEFALPEGNEVCGRFKRPNISTRIWGGRPIARYEFPSAVYLKVKGNHTCSGTLISERHLITAAHCVNESSPSDLHVWTGVEIKYDLKKALDVSKICTHKDYIPDKPYMDVSVLRLEKRLHMNDDVRHACWSFVRKRVDDEVDFVGAGNHAEKWVAREQHVMNSKVVDCKKELFDSGNKLCFTREKARPCTGDSGGGVYIVADNRHSLVGVLSSAADYCYEPLTNEPGIATSAQHIGEDYLTKLVSDC